MPASLSIPVKWESMQSFDTATLTGSFQAFGNPIPQAAIIVQIINGSTVPVTFATTDLTNGNFMLPSNSGVVYDICANASNTEGRYIPAGTQFYVNGSAGTGSLYLILLTVGK